MPKPTLKTDCVIRSPQVLDAFITLLRPHLPLDLQKTRITAAELIAVLAYASVNRTSIDAACAELVAMPLANRLWEVLVAALPARSALKSRPTPAPADSGSAAAGTRLACEEYNCWQGVPFALAAVR